MAAAAECGQTLPDRMCEVLVQPSRQYYYKTTVSTCIYLKIIAANVYYLNTQDKSCTGLHYSTLHAHFALNHVSLLRWA